MRPCHLLRCSENVYSAVDSRIQRIALLEERVTLSLTYSRERTTVPFSSRKCLLAPWPCDRKWFEALQSVKVLLWCTDKRQECWNVGNKLNGPVTDNLPDELSVPDAALVTTSQWKRSLLLLTGFNIETMEAPHVKFRNYLPKASQWG